MENSMEVPLKTKNKTSIWPCYPTSGHISGEKHDPMDTRTAKLIAALRTTARTRKQPQCPLTEEWIKKRSYIYTMKYYSAKKKSEIMLFAATWMELEIFILSEVSQTGEISYGIPYTWNLERNHTNELIYKTDSQTSRTNLWLPGEYKGEGIFREFGMDMYKLLYLK